MCRHFGFPFRAAVVAGAVAAAALATPIGYLAVRRTGIYFAMVTLAFAQMGNPAPTDLAPTPKERD